MQIGIIGFGNFGRLMARHLKTRADVSVSDLVDRTKEARELGVNFISIEAAASREIVILAVPMENLEETLARIRGHLQEGALVLDVCSLKMFSCRLMEEILPRNVEIIGTHPLFGPQSAPNSIAGMRIAITPVRTTRLEQVVSFCESLGLKVIVTSAEEHDRQMALSQALTHFIGQALVSAGIERVELSTKTFDNLMDIVEIIANDTPALFNNMQTMNPFAKEARQNFIDSLIKLDGRIKCN